MYAPRERILYAGSSPINAFPSAVSANAEQRQAGSAQSLDLCPDTTAVSHSVPRPLDNVVVATLTELCNSLKSMNGTKRGNYNNVPKFSGDDDDSFEQWREKFTTSAQLYDWSKTKQILLLHQALTDRAFAFYQSLSADIKSSMPQYSRL